MAYSCIKSFVLPLKLVSVATTSVLVRPLGLGARVYYSPQWYAVPSMHHLETSSAKEPLRKLGVLIHIRSLTRYSGSILTMPLIWLLMICGILMQTKMDSSVHTVYLYLIEGNWCFLI
jgi:hypothetical protein